MIKVVSNSKAMELALKFSPIFHQEFKSPLDLLMAINLGGFAISDSPTVYFSVKENASCYYLFYMTYHYRDWSALPPPIDQFDEHRHDNEGVLIAVNKKTQQIIWTASRAHRKIEIRDKLMVYEIIRGNKHPLFFIEAGGHGIHHWLDITESNLIEYREYLLVNMQQQKVWKWLTDTVSPEFKANGVSMPWDWQDYRIEKKYRGTSGLIWNDPGRLITIASEIGIVNK